MSCLSEKGLDWLTTCLVNLHREKRMIKDVLYYLIPLQSRPDCANEIMFKIFNSAEKPMTIKDAISDIRGTGSY